MAWNDDSWRDGYDAWKTREPDYGPCRHRECKPCLIYLGTAQCGDCGEYVELSADEIAYEREQWPAYDKAWRRHEWSQWWWEFRWNVRWRLRRVWQWPPKFRSPKIDDDIPF